jgi:fatty acid desaturase
MRYFADMTSAPPTDTAADNPTPPPPGPEASPRQRASMRKRLRLALRSGVLITALALTAFWIYTFYAIGAQANPKGDGMEWMAAFPMTLVFLLLTLPAMIIGLFGRALLFGAFVAALSIFVNVWIWAEILAEFAG